MGEIRDNLFGRGAGRKSIIMLEGYQAPPTCSSDKSGVKMKI
jgi:hypothetical protein